MASVVVIVLTHSLPWRHTLPLHSLSLNSPPSFSFFHSRPAFSIHYRRWDSNAENSRRFGFDFKRKPDDEDEEDEEEEDEEYYRTKGRRRRWWSDESPATEEGPGRTLADFFDAFWIFKVFKPYGWILPILLISPLVATGPKAFLMALAIPIGQSALSLAFEKLWGGSQSTPKRRRRMRKKQSSVTGADIEEDEEEVREPGKDRMSYQSWVVGKEDSVGKDGQRETTFGGWDDLERVKSAQRQSRRKGGTGTMETEKGKLSRRERKSDTPLLLRLLIAFFPFLGSWTKMLW